MLKEQTQALISDQLACIEQQALLLSLQDEMPQANCDGDEEADPPLDRRLSVLQQLLDSTQGNSTFN